MQNTHNFSELIEYPAITVTQATNPRCSLLPYHNDTPLPDSFKIYVFLYFLSDRRTRTSIFKSSKWIYEIIFFQRKWKNHINENDRLFAYILFDIF